MSSTTAHEFKISLPTAILININIMLGAGIFVNTPELAKRAGMLGGFTYILIGLLMLPLILTIMKLLELHPAGGFYAYSQREISPFAGFLSGWCYFTSKLASSMLMIHVSVTLLQHIFPTLKAINTFALDGATVALFIALNMLNIKAGSAIQRMFITFKIIPIFFAIFAGIFLLQPAYFSASHVMWDGVYSSLPLVLYAITGFEAACSVSGKIKNAKKNAPLAVLISFGVVILFAALYQTFFYAALGTDLCLGNHCDAFPSLLNALPFSPFVTNKLLGLIHIAIASSTLGAAYGIIFSNCWNLHILAQKNHIWFSTFFSQLNQNLIPFACVLAEGLLCIVYLTASQGNTIPLQQIGALGCILAYSFSVMALLQAKKHNEHKDEIHSWIPRLALISCTILMSACIKSFITEGIYSLMIYGSIIAIGVMMYFSTKRWFQERN